MKTTRKHYSADFKAKVSSESEVEKLHAAIGQPVMVRDF